MKQIILASVLILSVMFTASAQSLVKMNVPKQSDKPLQVVALFDEEIPSPALIRIFDVNGALCYTQTTASSLDIRVNLQAGMYFVAVATEGKQMVVKVMVE